MKPVIESLEAVPEALRTEYEPAKEGKGFVLKLEGDHPSIAGIVAQANAKVGEFRTNNIALLKQAEELTDKLKSFDGMDPAKYRELLKTTDDLKTKGVKDGADVSKLVEAALSPVLEKLKTFETREAAARTELAEKSQESLLMAAAIAAGVQDSAVPDFVSRGKKVFGADGVAKQNGTPVFSKKRPGEFLDVTEWAADLQAEAPHLYKASKGAGTTPGNGTGVPGAKGTFDGSDAGFLANIKGIAAGTVVRA
jgi:hypothetical protein